MVLVTHAYSLQYSRAQGRKTANFQDRLDNLKRTWGVVQG